MSRLNYDKWSKLEVSDDSDIEGHPNVDHKSLVRWKQRDIHEKREQRKFKLAALRSEIEMNGVIGPRMDELVEQIKREGSAYVERTVGQLRQATQSGKEGARPPNSKGPTYDMMILELLMQVVEEVKLKGLSGEERADAMVKRIEKHREQLNERTEQCKRDIETEEAEAQKKITSEDIKDGFSTSHLSKDPATRQIVEDPRPVSKQPTADVKGKGKETAVEVLNAPKATGASAAADDDEDTIPELTSNAEAYSLIPIDKPEKLFGAISRDPSLLKASTTDALLMKAFNAAMKGDPTLCRQCIHNGLTLQYATKLGKDGVSLFFSRLQGGPGRQVFMKDVDDTFMRIWKRGNEMAAEDRAKKASGVEEEGEEQIQLVAEDPNVTIGFDVPDGPPPENITLEGEGTEDLDVEEVKAFLQRRWDIFDSFPPNLRKALQANDLAAVNKVLGRMAVDQAEEVVGQLQEARILSFSEPGVRDQTGKAA